MKNDLKLLDCTLRDGGYINNWEWGFDEARAIIRLLTKANVEFVEVGFLRNIDCYDENITVSDNIEQLNRLLPENQQNVIYSAMAMRSNYDIGKLRPYSGQGIQMIRVTAHDNDLAEGLTFAERVKDLGYLLSINPINIMGYSDREILALVEHVNQIAPYQFSIVDTFGSMKRRDLDRIVSLVDNNLEHDIRLALHLHENMSLGCCLAQQFIDKHLNRPVAVDASLLGMGRTPGNLAIELIADYLNEYLDKNYDIDYMLDAISEYIMPKKGKSEWGYAPEYFLSARYNLHRNYSEFYLKQGDLSSRDINHILAGFDRSKATVFDREYALLKYDEYKNTSIDDEENIRVLKDTLVDKDVVLLAPGKSINDNMDSIKAFIEEHAAVVISINCIPVDYTIDYAFYGNGKRFSQADERRCKLIVTSNVIINETTSAIRINYNRVSSAYEQEYNSYVMALKLLSEVGVKKVYVAGADGYINGALKYYNPSFRSSMEINRNHNETVKTAVKRIGIEVIYITDSAYR